MSALQFIKTPTGTAQCSEPGCIRGAKYRMLIADYPVKGPSALVPHELVCPRCRKNIEAMWSELTGETARIEALEVLPGLGSEGITRVDAIDALRELGFSPEQVGAAKEAIEDGAELGSALEALAA